MTSPRAPRLLGWTVPNHLKVWVEGADIRVACMHFHAADTTTTSVPLGDDDAQTLIGHFLRDHAHGATVEYRPLSEVLPETPEPPREGQPVRVIMPADWREQMMDAWRAEHPSKLEPLGLLQSWVTATPPPVDAIGMLWPDLADEGEHVPASQSVPAVPVSSTGGKETGEAAETATEALSPVPYAEHERIVLEESGRLLMQRRAPGPWIEVTS